MNAEAIMEEFAYNPMQNVRIKQSTTGNFFTKLGKERPNVKLNVNSIKRSSTAENFLNNS
jgi:hypothetical protein